MSYDSKCFDLAEHFLDVDEIEAGAMMPIKVTPELYAKLCALLAQHIQSAVEDWIQYEMYDLPIMNVSSVLPNPLDEKNLGKED